MRKRWMKALPVVLLTAMLGLAGCSGGGQQNAAGTDKKPEAAGSPAKTDINIWLWDKTDSRAKMYEEFTKLYPQYNIVMTAVESKDMAQKLQTALASGADLPDVAWLEQTYRGKLLSLNIWEDLSKAPYNLDKSQVLDYLVPLETTESGVYVGPEAPSVAGMAYKRALAKQYFGTEDRAELEKIFTDWDTFIQKGIEVKEKSNGKVFMFASLGDAYAFLKGQTNTPFIQGTTLNLKQGVGPLLDKLVQMKKAGIIDVLDTNSPAANASYTDDLHIFYPCANWSVEFTIKANDKNGVGRWGFMIPPGGPFPLGGTLQGVPQKAKNKVGGAEFVKWLFLTEKGSEVARDYKGNFSPFKPIYQKADFYSKKEEHFAGQDVQKAIAQDVFPKIKSVRLPSKYDQDIDDSVNVAMKTINASKDGNVAVDQLIKKMEDDLKSKQPDLKVQ
ncbi:ABC transporter substrate-binding protein [Paenibacillus sp. FSL H7-0331]|uniref:ABC transporter substrate-binding protein n=1 Tax=Paenibacillus sp. FSL H7-0331 TaxID=1920421 RepID=UPI00096F480B|nr:ABC transporter substrate-binding protein [Paenibacillus sp. FSL H7-0331]OMF19146.1 sugar ABC transporter substrate-binding protein [Paenibacillus sp. FSL H7-0331]